MKATRIVLMICELFLAAGVFFGLGLVVAVLSQVVYWVPRRRSAAGDGYDVTAIREVLAVLPAAPGCAARRISFPRSSAGRGRRAAPVPRPPAPSNPRRDR